jgi:hypothetical protein
MQKGSKKRVLKVNLNRGFVEVRPSTWVGGTERNLGIQLGKLSGPANITRIKVEYTRNNPLQKYLEHGIVEIRPTYERNGVWRKLRERIDLLKLIGAVPKRVRVEYTIKKNEK